MSVPGSVVAAATTVVASPLLWLVYEGEVPLDVAVQRLVVCVVACWALLAVVGHLAFSPLREQRPDSAPEVLDQVAPEPVTAPGTAPPPGT